MGNRVLIVEDNQENLELLRELLTLKGYRTIEATNGKKVIEVVSRERPDLVLMDIQLPEVDGISALKALRDDPRTKDIPIIAITAHAMKGDRENFIKEGFDGYIAKPISIKDLLTVLSIYLPQGSD